MGTNKVVASAASKSFACRCGIPMRSDLKKKEEGAKELNDPVHTKLFPFWCAVNVGVNSGPGVGGGGGG